MDPQSRVERVVTILGNARTAQILGVSGSQPSRWRKGEERVSQELLPALIDLDYVVSRLLAVWAPEVARLWLEADNRHLRGRPVDVMILKGPRSVLDALDAIDAGSYA